MDWDREKMYLDRIKQQLFNWPMLCAAILIILSSLGLIKLWVFSILTGVWIAAYITIHVIKVGLEYYKSIFDIPFITTTTTLYYSISLVFFIVGGFLYFLFPV